jgi:uncharacterized membrane protein
VIDRPQGRAVQREDNMDGSQDWRGDTSDIHRAEAFSDAVFAIVITLLVLDLRPPQVPSGQLLIGLLEQWPIYMAYVMSYIYVAVVWLNHKAAFMHVRLMDRTLHWANLGILFTTALLPFPTAVLSDAMTKGNPIDERTAVALYALVGAVLCVSWLAFFVYLSRHPELLMKKDGTEFFAAESTRAWIGVVFYVIAGILGYVITPSVALIIFFILPVFYGVTSHGLNLLLARRSP